MAGGKRSVVGNSRYLVALIGVTICYQLVYQVVMWHALQDIESIEGECVLGAPGSSPHCMEAELFRGWSLLDQEEIESRELPEDLELLAQETHHEEPPKNGDHIITTQAHDLTPAGHIESSTDNVLNELEEKAHQRHVQFDKMYESVLASLNQSSVTHWAENLVAEEDDLEKRMDNWTAMHSHHNGGLRGSNHHARHTTHDSEKVFPSHTKAFRTAATTTEKPELEDEIYEFARSLCEVPGHENNARCSKFLGEMCNQPKRRNAPYCAGFLAAISANSSKAGSVHEESIHTRVQAQHAAHAAKRARIQIEASEHAAALEARHAGLEASHRQWENSLSTGIEDFERDLCADPRRHGYPACAKFLAKGASSASSTPKDAGETGSDVQKRTRSTSALRGGDSYSQRFHWSTVVSSWKAAEKKKGGNDSPVVVSKKELRHTKWQGKIPKVACVTGVPSGAGTKAQMKYFIDNFKLQSYEGPRQLILVYRKSDVEIGKLVQSYADGVYIKGVAYREDGEFPSTTSLRYGAWTSDADIIARWNFDEWHHPHRLAMQVHALAVTSRPVSVLKQLTVLQGTGQTLLTANPGWEGSLVGEVSWMRKNWMPLMGEERHMLEILNQKQLVQVDMPELTVYTPDETEAWADILHHFGLAA